MPAIQLMTVSNTETTPAAETKSVKTQGLKSAFSNYMRQNSSNTAQTAKDQPAALQAKAADSGSNVKQQYEQYQNQNKSAVKTEQASNGSETDTDTVTQAVDEAVESIKESIKENLGVDEEQLAAAMELLGLTQADLLDPKQLVALAVELTGSEDAGMMLFQENFQIVMQETSVITKDLLQELGMSMDDLMTQIHTALESDQTRQPIETMLPDQQPAETPQIVQEEAPSQMQTTQTVLQETPQSADTATQETTTLQREAVQTEQAVPQETDSKQPQAVQVQEEQPQEIKQAVKTEQGQQQQNPQAGQQEALTEEQPQEAPISKQQPQEQTRFDFHAQVQPQEANAGVQAPQNLTNEAPLPQTNLQDVIDQIVEYTKVNLSEDVKSIEMQLNPANLGKVYLHVSEKQGVVTAQLSAQNENLKEALVQQAVVLKENLNQQGIKVDAVEVSAGAHEFESNLERDAHSQEEQARQQEEQSRRQSRRTIHVDDLNSLDGISGLMSEEEALVAQIMRDNGNNIDYKA